MTDARAAARRLQWLLFLVLVLLGSLASALPAAA